MQDSNPVPVERVTDTKALPHAFGAMRFKSCSKEIC